MVSISIGSLAGNIESRALTEIGFMFIHVGSIHTTQFILLKAHSVTAITLERYLTASIFSL